MATGPSGSLAASVNSPVALPIAAIAVRARISAIGRRMANPSRGRSARVVTIAAHGRVSTSRGLIARATTVPATNARGFRDRAIAILEIACRATGLAAIGRSASGRNSIAETGRSSIGRDGSDRQDRSERKFDPRPRDRKSDPEGRRDWQEHPRSDDRPRRENEDDSKVFAKRPAFGGRGEYRERKRDFDKRDDKRAPREEPKPKKDR